MISSVASRHTSGVGSLPSKRDRSTGGPTST
jgi:hypothetical protein